MIKWTYNQEEALRTALHKTTYATKELDKSVFRVLWKTIGVNGELTDHDVRVLRLWLNEANDKTSTNSNFLKIKKAVMLTLAYEEGRGLIDVKSINNAVKFPEVNF